MGCGCGKRAVALLERMGYRRVRRAEAGNLESDPDGDLLVKGEYLIPVEEAETHHARVTARAAARQARDFIRRFKEGA